MRIRTICFLLIISFAVSSCAKRKGNRAKPKKRSVAYLMERVQENEFEPEWFKAKMKIKSEENYFGVKTLQANIRSKRGEVVWASVSVQIGIKMEVARAYITPDSVKVVDKFNKRYYAEPISYLQNMVKYPLDFYALEDLLWGNIPDPPAYDAAQNVTGAYLLEALGEELSLDPNDYQILSIKKKAEEGELKIEHLKNELIEDRPFPVERKYSILADQPYIFNATFSQVSFDEPNTFPFKIPDDYTRVR